MKKTLIALMLFASIPFHAQAQNMNGRYYEILLRAEIMRKKTIFELVKIEAEMGDPNCQYLTGTYYLQGFGTPKDLNEAKKWFIVAANNGQKYAKRMVRDIADMENRSSTITSETIR